MKVKLFEIVTDRDKISMTNVVEVFNNKSAIKDWACILHDKDNTREHYHIAVRLKDSYDTKYIAEWFGIGENFISKVKGRWSDMLKYLIHENAPEKHQYPEEEVLSNFDWKVEKDKVSGEERKNEIINNIVDGTIREYNYTDSVNAIENDKYRISIDRAFKYRLDRIKGVERHMECIFITGDSGVGKTTYARKLANEKNYSVYVSSGSNDILDDYKGQDCIILDDLRGSSMGLADLLKMLDNNTASTVKSRYKNKVLECKLIIITTTESIDRFFKNVFSDNEETIIQLQRRCETHIRMEKDRMYVKLWRRKSRAYGAEYILENPISSQFISEDLTREEELEKLSDMLGDIKIVDYMRDNQIDYCSQSDIDDIENVQDENCPFEK